jgi:hypothetical protein
MKTADQPYTQDELHEMKTASDIAEGKRIAKVKNEMSKGRVAEVMLSEFKSAAMAIAEKPELEQHRREILAAHIAAGNPLYISVESTDLVLSETHVLTDLNSQPERGQTYRYGSGETRKVLYAFLASDSELKFIWAVLTD